MTLVQVYKYCTASHCHYISHIQSFLCNAQDINFPLPFSQAAEHLSNVGVLPIMMGWHVTLQCT